MGTVGMVALGLLLLWVLGGVLMRLAGVAFLLIGLAGLAFAGDAEGIVIAAVGTLLWLLGHGHHMLRHGTWKSAPARSVWHLVAAALGRLVPRGDVRVR